MALAFGPRRGYYLDIGETLGSGHGPLDAGELAHLDRFDALYRALCAMLFNYVPTSGHPGGSISSGRFVACLLSLVADYDVGAPSREDADIVSYAAGHKAMGLYAMWALRDELARVGDPGLLSEDDHERLRLEDLLGFRRNPISSTPLFVKFGAKALDGHPTPATPFVRLATGASGVGVASSIGLALGARDRYGENAPRVHIVEGEGGLTPGRVSEALAAAGTSGLGNVILHLDWNQASIDSERVCRDGRVPGDYVQWDPRELFYLHDWNVIDVPDGFDFQQIVAAQRRAQELTLGQPTAIVYRTVKGWRYGVEGRASHGGGHKLCSEGYYEALADLGAGIHLPECDSSDPRCKGGEEGAAEREACFWQALEVLRDLIQSNPTLAEFFAVRLRESRERLNEQGREPRRGAPEVGGVYSEVAARVGDAPASLRLQPGSTTTLRAQLGHCLRHLNDASSGAVLTASADLLGSTSIDIAGTDFPGGFWQARANPDARQLSVGGICEDAITGVLTGVASFGHAIGVGSSYGAFMAPLGHIPARLHAIGQQASATATGAPPNPIVLVCGHTGLKTGEDGPTHADPQALQLLQQNFPLGTAISLTPWEPQEIWTLLAASLVKRPAVISAFVTRPSETVLDREALGLAPAAAAAEGVYALRQSEGEPDVTIVLQESAVAYEFVEGTLPILEEKGVDALVYYVASAELFDLLPTHRRQQIFPEERGRESIGITGFTLPTLFRWVRSDLGLAESLHPYRGGHYLGSGPGEDVLREAGLDGESQATAILAHLDARARSVSLM